MQSNIISRRDLLVGVAAAAFCVSANSKVDAMTRSRTATDYIVVHGAYTTPDMDTDAKTIDQWHRKRGFLQIGYHAVIRRDGTVEAGRADHLIGAGVYGWNDVSYHICLVGGKSPEGGWEANYTGVQYDALRFLLRQKQIQYPNAEVQGHTDFPRVAKKCPAFDVKEWYR